MSETTPHRDGLGELVSRALSNHSFIICLFITLVVATMAIVSFSRTPFDVTRLIVADRMQLPSAAQ